MAVENQILYYRVKSLKSNLPQIIVGAATLPLLTYLCIRETAVLYWFSSYCVGALFFLVKSWKLSSRLDEDSSREDLTYFVKFWGLQSFYFSSFWAALPWLPNNADLPAITACGFVIAGVTSATTISCVAFPHISRIYSLLSLTSFVVRLTTLGNSSIIPLAIMVGLFLAMVLRMQRTLYSYFLQTFKTMIDLESANQKIQESQSAAVLSSKLAAQAEMTANLAHEINNPLAIIHLKTDYLLRSKKKGKLTDQMVEDVCNKSIEMIHRIQEIIESTKKYFYNDQYGEYDSEVELSELINEISGIYKEKCQRRGIHFEKINDENVTVIGGRTAVLQVITNLLNNAFDAVKDMKNPSIKLEIILHENHAFVQVQDSGEGISDEVRQRIFEPFYTTKGKGAGLGIGLSICLGLARDMGGDLWLEPDSPTTFCFRMKRKKALPKVA